MGSRDEIKSKNTHRWKAPEVQPILAELIEVLNSSGDWRLCYSKLPFMSLYSSTNDFQGAPLSGINVNERNFEGIRFDFSDMRNARFNNCQFFNCSFGSADLRNSSFIECDFEKCNIYDVNLENADLTYSTFFSVVISSSNLKNANFSYTDFIGGQFLNCKLENTIFTGADLSYAFISKYYEEVNPRLEAMHNLMMASDTALSIADLRKLLKRLEGETHNLFTPDEIATWVNLYQYFQDKLYDAYHQSS